MATRTRGLPVIRQVLPIVLGQPWVDGGDMPFNLGTLFKGFEQRGGLQTYLLGFRIHAKLVFGGGGAATIGANGDFARWLRAARLTNSPHDILLTGEYLRAWSWLRYQRWWHDDPASITAGGAATRDVWLEMQFYDPYANDQFAHVDPLQRFIDSSQQLILTTAPRLYWDASNGLTVASCSVDLYADVLRTPKKYAAAPFAWKYEDRNSSNQIVTLDGAIEYLDLSKPPVQQTAGLTELTAVFDSIKIDPFELMPQTKVLDIARQWEVTCRQDAQISETSAPSNLIDPVTPAIYFLPVINRSRQLELNIAEQPYIRGDLNIQPVLAAGTDYTARWFYRATRPSQVGDAVAAAASVGVPADQVAAHLGRHNPQGNAQPARVKALSRLRFDGKGQSKPTAQQQAIARAGVK